MGFLCPSGLRKFLSTMSLCQKERTPLSKFNLKKMAVISKLHTKLHSFNKIPYYFLVNLLLNSKITSAPSFPCTFTQKERENSTTTKNYKTLFVLSNKFTPAKKSLHNRWLRLLRHIEGMCTVFTVDDT